MRFSQDFLQNMLENGHSNLQQTCECISLQIFSKYPIQKSRDRTNSPDLPTLKAYPTPPTPLEGTQSNFTPWLCDFEHQGENR